MAVVGTAITSYLVSAGVGAATAQLVGTVAVRLLTSAALSILSQVVGIGVQKPRESGLQTDVATSGDSTPQSFILGRYATAGNMVCPPMTAGRVEDSPNGFLTYVIDVSDIPVRALTGVWVDDQKITLSTQVTGASSKYPGHYEAMDELYHNEFWIKFNNGNQTAADPSLLTQNEPDRPWSADMIGRGIAYVICRFRFNREVYKSFPRVLLEVDGIGLYDPRRDTTAGGGGPQRWGNRSTYVSSSNPVVQIYNILRGIELMDGSVWGGDAAGSDLPLANWFAAMNACDVVVDGAPTYVSGMEVRVGPQSMSGDEPANIIEELLKTCSGQIFEYGGVWKIKVGGSSAPVAVFTDEDIIVTSEQSFEPFKGLAESFNGVHAQYPEPLERWVSKEAPPRYNAAFEAEDMGHRLVASLTLPACPYPKQVQRLMKAYIQDERRQRRHMLTLPPDYAVIEPLDDVTWNSERNGYVTKQFEVFSKSEDLRSLLGQFSVRERDPNDYNWTSDFELPTTVNPVFRPTVSPVQFSGFIVDAVYVRDDQGRNRRPALRLAWNADSVLDARGVQYEIRPNGQSALVAQGVSQDVRRGELYVSEGILSNVAYQARILPVTTRLAAWTSWVTVQSRTIGLGNDDFEGGISRLFRDQGMYAIQYVDALPTSGAFDGQLVFLTTDGKLYRWVAAQNRWVPVVENALNRALDETSFVQGISIPRVVSALPTTGNFVGRMVVLSTDGKLYRWTGSAWTAAVPAVDVIGQLTDSQIADIAAAKLTGQITGPQIENSAINAARLAAGAVDATKMAASIKPIEIVSALPGTPHVAGRVVFLTTDNKLYRNTGSAWTAAIPAADISGQVAAAQIAGIEASKVTGQLTATQIASLEAAKITGAITGTQIADNAISTPKIAAGAVVTNNLAANAVTANQIAANAITTAKIAAGAVVTASLAAGAVTASTIAAGAVVAGKIAANAVTAETVEADAITAGKIAASAINTRELAAGAVTTAKMVVGVTDNLFPDSQLQDVTSWVLSNGATLTVTVDPLIAGPGAKGAISTPGTAGNNWNSFASLTNNIRIYDNREYSLNVRRKRYVGQTGSAVGRVVVVWRSPTGSVLSSANMNLTTITTDAVMDDSLRLVPPAGAASFSVAFQYNQNATGVHLRGVDVFERNAGQLIVDGSIYAAQISANAISTDKLAAGAVTAVTIAAGAVSTAKLAAGAVTADQIAANAITSVKIAAGAVTANEIAANSITSDKIVANSITSAKIAAGAVAADQIAAGAIIASKLAITDFTNLVPDDQMQDPSSWWVNPDGRAVVTHLPNQGTASARSKGLFQVNPNGTNITQLIGRPSSGKPGTEYYFAGQIYSAAFATVTVILQFLNVNEEPVGSKIIASEGTGWRIAADSAVAPAGTLYVRLLYQINASSYGGDIIYLAAPVIRAKATGALIVDGTITGDKIVANTITGGLLATSGVITTSAQITNAIITTAKIADLAVNTLKIGDNAVSMSWASNTNQLSIGLTYPAQVTIVTNARIAGITNPYTANCLIKVNGNNVEIGNLSLSQYTWRNTMIKTINLPAGTHTIRHEYESSSGSLSSSHFSEYRIVAIGFYR